MSKCRIMTDNWKRESRHIEQVSHSSAHTIYSGSLQQAPVLSSLISLCHNAMFGLRPIHPLQPVQDYLTQSSLLYMETTMLITSLRLGKELRKTARSRRWLPCNIAKQCETCSATTQASGLLKSPWTCAWRSTSSPRRWCVFSFFVT